MLNDSNISDLLLEKYLLNELIDEDLKRVQDYLKNPEALNRLNALKASNKEILEAFPPEEMVTIIEGRRHNYFDNLFKAIYSLFTKPISRYAFGSAFAIVFIYFLVTPFFLSNYEQYKPNRLKGLKQHLLIYKKSGSSVEKLTHNSFAKENDILQISYVSSGFKYGMIFSIDGRRAVTLHYPANIKDNSLLNPEGEIFLQNSFQLDDAPSFEKFIFLASNKTINVKETLNKITLLLESNNSIETFLSETSDIKHFTFKLNKMR